MHGTPPEKPSQIQLTLRADGRISFSYKDVLFGDGLVGLFPSQTPTKDTIIASFDEGVDNELPRFLDVLNVAIYSTNIGDTIVEFTTGGPVPLPLNGDAYEYRLYFDTDQPVLGSIDTTSTLLRCGFYMVAWKKLRWMVVQWKAIRDRFQQSNSLCTGREQLWRILRISYCRCYSLE